MNNLSESTGWTETNYENEPGPEIEPCTWCDPSTLLGPMDWREPPFQREPLLSNDPHTMIESTDANEPSDGRETYTQNELRRQIELLASNKSFPQKAKFENDPGIKKVPSWSSDTALESGPSSIREPTRKD